MLPEVIKKADNVDCSAAIMDIAKNPTIINLENLLGKVDLGNQVAATEETFISEDITSARRESSICGWIRW